MKPSLDRRAISASALSALALTSCVERKMVIRSDPAGALITLDGVETEMRTPAEIPFDFGGTRSVVLTSPGRKVLESTAKLEDPWFTYFPLDVGAEFLWPGTIRDVQTFDYKIEAYQPVDRSMLPELKKKLDELKLRAAQYRAGGSDGPGAAPPPSTTTPPADAPKK